MIRLYLFKSLLEKPGVPSPEVSGIKILRLTVFTCQHAAPNGTVAHNSNAKLSAHRDQVFLQPPASSVCCHTEPNTTGEYAICQAGAASCVT